MTGSDLPQLTAPFLKNLRPLAPKDAEKLTEACQDAETQRWTNVPPAYTLDMAHAFIRGTECKWAMTDERDDFCGVIELRPRNDFLADLGYHTAPWARGQGFTTDAVVTVTEWAFGQGFHRIELKADVNNLASRRVAEKAGFAFEGVARGSQQLHGRFDDLAVYARLATD